MIAPSIESGPRGVKHHTDTSRGARMDGRTLAPYVAMWWWWVGGSGAENQNDHGGGLRRCVRLRSFSLDAGLTDAGTGTPAPAPAPDGGSLLGDAGSSMGIGGATAGGQMLGCQSVLFCVNNCPVSSSCVQTCLNQATQGGGMLYTELTQCLTAAGCATSGGGICDHAAKGFNETNCQACVNSVSGVGGLCAPEMQNCLNNN